MASSAFVFNPVSIGHNFSFFLTHEGVWCCGSKTFGGLGMGVSCLNTLKKAVKVEFSQVIYSVCCGQGHTLFLNSEGKVWACGWNAYGQLGALPLSPPRYVPVEICDLPKIRSIHTSYNHTILLDCEGEVWICGGNNCGQVGDDRICLASYPFKKVRKDLPKIQAINAGESSSMFVDTEGGVWCVGTCKHLYKSTTVEKVKGLPPIQFVSHRDGHSLFLDYNGSVWACGSNFAGQLGVGNLLLPSKFSTECIKVPSTEIFVAISTGRAHSLFLTGGGQVFVCGSDAKGQLGLGQGSRVNVPTPLVSLPPIAVICAGIQESIFADREGVCWACGSDSKAIPDVASAVPIRIEQLPPVIHELTVTHVKSARNLL